MNCTGCSAPASLLTVRKEGTNKGRQFYTCPQPRGERDGGCKKFFEWVPTTPTTPSRSGQLSREQFPPHASASAAPPAPPRERDTSKTHNLSDAKYCCVWSVEPLAAPDSEAVRSLLQRVADAVAPVLAYRGWRVKRLMESVSRTAGGLCTTNGRTDADATSANIQLNVRIRPDVRCTQLKSYKSLLGVMIHEITHISIGLEDIHPPAFYDLMRENRRLCMQLSGNVVDTRGGVGLDKEILHSDQRIQDAAIELPDEQFACGVKKKWKRKSVGVAKAVGVKAEEASEHAKKRPLLKGAKMVDGRTGDAKRIKDDMAERTPRELAAEAAARRFQQAGPVKREGGGGKEKEKEKEREKEKEKEKEKEEASTREVIEILSSSEEEEEEEELVVSQHDIATCVCRACEWERVTRF